MSARSKPPVPISGVPGETDRGTRGLLLTLPNPSTVGPLTKMIVFVSFTSHANKNINIHSVSKKSDYGNFDTPSLNKVKLHPNEKTVFQG